MSRSRTGRGLAVAVVTTLLLSACSFGPTGPAATVDGVAIPRSDLEEWVRTASNDNPSVNPVTLQADLLARAVQQRVIDAVLAERGLTVDPSVTERIRADIEEQLGGPLSLAMTLADVGFPQDFFDRVFLPVEAAIDTLVLSLLEGEALETRTARHILVETEAEAQEVVALLAEGIDFAVLALERSLDTGSGRAGGNLGPQQRGVFVPPFDDAVWSASTGRVLPPVRTDFGFHVIEVTAIDRTPASELPSDLRRQVASAELESILTAAFVAADVSVNPTIGTWDPLSATITPPVP